MTLGWYSVVRLGAHGSQNIGFLRLPTPTKPCKYLRFAMFAYALKSVSGGCLMSNWFASSMSFGDFGAFESLWVLLVMLFFRCVVWEIGYSEGGCLTS